MMPKRVLPLVLLLSAALTMIFSCRNSNTSANEIAPAAADDELTPSEYIAETIVTDEDTFNAWNDVSDSLPGNCVPLRYRALGDLRRVFNDSNHVHYKVAERTGVNPISTLRDAWHVGKPLVKVVSCKDYFVQPLNYSVPYLIPSAERCLRELGRRFNDSLAARGGGAYRIKVTSVLRTAASVKRLRRVNINAVDSSTHRFATTFDVSASRFICDDFTQTNRSLNDLKGLLAEIIYMMQQEKKLYIKYERRNCCFHITSRMAEQS